jgi:hypothetical protein
MTHEISSSRPTSYDKKIGLVLQGGGALGSYQAGVYEALPGPNINCRLVAIGDACCWRESVLRLPRCPRSASLTGPAASGTLSLFRVSGPEAACSSPARLHLRPEPTTWRILLLRKNSITTGGGPMVCCCPPTEGTVLACLEIDASRSAHRHRAGSGAAHHGREAGDQCSHGWLSSDTFSPTRMQSQ